MRLFGFDAYKLLMKELKRSFKFFWKEVNSDVQSKGYGLIRDKTTFDTNIASIASVGYGLAGLVIGAKYKWISYQNAYQRATGTLDTFLNNVEGENGFYYHFVDIETGKRAWDCEISIIDTAIFICGAITAGEYFGKDVKEKAEILYKKIDWEWYRNKDEYLFFMGYKPEQGFWGHWDLYAEQLMLYVLGVASLTFPVERSMYYDFQRKHADYKDIKDIIYSYTGNLFTYQFSHAWINFMNIKADDNIDWFDNSVKATKANRAYCIDNKSNFRTYSEYSWGLTACVGPSGYKGFGAQPCEIDPNAVNDGTVAPCGAIGSIVFTPQESLDVMKYFYDKLPKLWGKYGFKDAYNLEGDKPWFAEEYIGIDKGIELVMIENYLNGTIWKYFMQNKYVKSGLDKLGFRKEEDTTTNNLNFIFCL